MPKAQLELAELLNSLAGTGQNTQNVETDLQSSQKNYPCAPAPKCTYSLAQWSALTNGDLVTLLNTESGRDVGGEVLVALLVTGVLGDEVKVLAADNQGTVHLGGNDGAGQDTATDGDETGERALLVCSHSQYYSPLSGFLFRFEVHSFDSMR